MNKPHYNCFFVQWHLSDEPKAKDNNEVKGLFLALALLQTTGPTPEVELAQLNTSLWVSLSNAPQQKPDIAQLQRLFAADATVSGGRVVDGAVQLSVQAATDFIAGQDRVKPYGFYECEVAREVRHYENFATVLSIVESRRDPNAAAADFTGVNSVQWALTDAGWKIVSLYYQVPENDAPLGLMEYKSGKCLNDYS